MKSVAERVKFVRSLTGLSSNRLSSIAGLHRSTVRVLERGERKTGAASTLIALARVTGAPPDWLMTGMGSAPTRQSVKRAISQYLPAEAAL